MKRLKDKKISKYILVFFLYLLVSCFNSNKDKNIENSKLITLEFFIDKIELKEGLATINFKINNKSNENYFIIKSYKSSYDNFIYPKIDKSGKTLLVNFNPQISKKNETYIDSQKNTEPIEISSDEYEIEIIKKGENLNKKISFQCSRNIRSISLKLYAGTCIDKNLFIFDESIFFISPTSDLLEQFFFQEYLINIKL